MLKLLLPSEIGQLLKIIVCFPGEASDHCRSHHQPVDPGPQCVQNLFLSGTRCFPGHSFEHRIACMLKRHVNVRQDPLCPGQGIDQTIVNVHGVKIHQPNPVK